MRNFFFIAFSLFVLKINSQEQSLLKPGDRAPGIVLTLQQNSVQSFSMPYLNRCILLHFWSTNVLASKAKNKSLNRLAKRYKNAIYKNADGFELIAIAVQSDKKAWNEDIKNDSLTEFINSIAQRGYNEDVCKKYGVNALPKDILIDEKGIVIAINPKLSLIEELLDEKKNFLPIKKDVVGIITNSTNQNETLKSSKLYLLDAYYDTVSTARTNTDGVFTFYDIKSNQDLIIKLDDQIEITKSNTLALLSSNGNPIVDCQEAKNGRIFYIPSNMVYKLTDENADESLNGAIDKVNVIKNLTFLNNGTALTLKDEQDLHSILLMLQKNKDLMLNITTHSDSKSDEKAAMALTIKQAKTIKDYLIKKGVEGFKIKTFPKGKTQPRKACKANTDCSDADHKQNRRVEFLVYKN